MVREWGTLNLPALVRAVVGVVHVVGVDVIHIQHAAGTCGFKRAVFFLPSLLRAAGCCVPLVTTVHKYGWPLEAPVTAFFASCTRSRA